MVETYKIGALTITVERVQLGVIRGRRPDLDAMGDAYEARRLGRTTPAVDPFFADVLHQRSRRQLAQQRDVHEPARPPNLKPKGRR